MIKQQFPLDFQWPVQDPFLFCVHHHDMYPKGTSSFGPEEQLLQGRDLGMDFEPMHGFRMYHGKQVPGFPVHPHRGFETITIVRKGYVDHSDSLGAAGRYGEGDVQWMTAGSGVQHSEMFPLLKQNEENTLELFQIWLNLPRRNKTVPAHFKMFWSEQIPEIFLDEGKSKIKIIAGEFQNQKPLSPPPASWAADPANEVSILLIKLASDGSVTIPATDTPCNRTLYFFSGKQIEINGQTVSSRRGVVLDSTVTTTIRNVAGDTPVDAEVLLLQAKPIGEPVVQHGPFVMNSREDIVNTIRDYQTNQFGGWPWARQDMVHGSTIERFAKYPDGRVEKPKSV